MTLAPWLEFVVDGNPRPWERAGSNGTRRYTPTATTGYEGAVAWEAKKAMGALRAVAAELVVDVWFYRNSSRRCDGDNLLKAVFDGLIGIVWEDDSQVVDFHGHKRVDRARPRTEVRVWLTEDSS